MSLAPLKTGLLTVTVAALAGAGVAGAAGAGARPLHASDRPPTASVIVRPVTAHGRPARGYRVAPGVHDTVTCTSRSVVAVDRGIDFCGVSADYGVACWHSHHRSVLCLPNPRVKRLIRYHLKGRFTRTRPLGHPSPAGVQLANGLRCTIRDGGAWAPVKGHPHWYGTYSCNTPRVDLYGTGRDGIDHGTDPWRVHTVRFRANGTQNVVDRRVATAYYVGTK